MGKKHIYFFSKDDTDGNRELKNLLGGKGANLAEMSNLGLPIPPGFTISTEVCEIYYQSNYDYPQEIHEEIKENVQKLEKVMGKKLGDKDDPLLVSVRSGAAVSMPGMMDTVLNLGMNDRAVEGMAKQSGNARTAYDSYRRFIQMFADVVLGIDRCKFEQILDEKKNERNIYNDVDLDANDLKDITRKYKELVFSETGAVFPQDAMIQLKESINAVFKSWNNERAIKYRQLNKIVGLTGTAVNVQAMVFGNLGENSGTGVAFSRDASTGENIFYGEYLMNAQGEDVVAGIRTPNPLSDLEKQQPEIYRELVSYKEKLEKHYRDMQDLEFTIQEKKLYILQTRNGKRTTFAAIKMALDMENEGLLTRDDAIMRVSPDQLDQLLHPTFDPDEKSKFKVIGKGLPASPGAAVGKIVFSAEKAEQMHAAGEEVILVRKETSPEDIGGMAAAQGILTATGGLTSHAAVVARGMGKSCIAGCGDLVIKPDNSCELSGRVFQEGDYISQDGTQGLIYQGKIPLIEPEISADFKKFMSWVDERRTIDVRTNADTPHDSKKARSFGAEGIGLCRTEHMFFEGDRINTVREMILAKDEKGRKQALDKLLPMQKNDFLGIFEAMDGFPVTIRLLDPPLHEFLPHSDNELQELARLINVDFKFLKQKTESLREFNPMLGHRGCRLAITFPEIAEMQAEAIISAALEARKKGIKVLPEIMIPLIGTEKEFEFLKAVIDSKAKEIFARENDKIDYQVGTMIEIPRACLIADKIAESAEFFSFGTNDLTQMTFGYSRDDAGVFLPDYIGKGILDNDPFQILDQEGVGQLVEIAITKGRQKRADLKIGICGEHGGEPSSVEFCFNKGMNYVSCSPYRVPIARLAAAQSAIKQGK